MDKLNLPAIRALCPAWNKGRIVGLKRPLKPKHVWAIRVIVDLKGQFGWMGRNGSKLGGTMIQTVDLTFSTKSAFSE